MCEVAQRFAGWLGLRPEHPGCARVRLRALGRTRIPGRRRRRDPAADASPARGAETSRCSSPPAGPDEARAVIERRSGAAYEPELAELAARNFDDMLAELDEARMWEQALESEPTPLVWIAGERIDAAFAAIAAITGLKSPWLREHSTGVAELAEAAAWRMGLPADSVTLLRRAALAHDLGRVGVSNAIWEKPGPLGLRRVGARAAAPALHRARLRPVAGARPDRAAGRLTPRAARRLRLPPRHPRAGARSGRPHPRRRRLLRAPCARRGRTGRRSTPRRRRRSCCARRRRDGSTRRPSTRCSRAAGHRVAKRPRELPAGLTPRELEVLLALVRGQSNQAIADGSRHLGQDRRAPRPARLREGRRPQAGRRDALGLRARPRSRSA